VPGVSERVGPVACVSSPSASLVRGVLRMENSIQNAGYRAELLDVSGRKVMALLPGDNDVRGLAPGVYFVREEGPMVRGAKGCSVRKVVIAR